MCIVYSTLFSLNILVYLNYTLYHFKKNGVHFRPLVTPYISTTDVGMHIVWVSEWGVWVRVIMLCVCVCAFVFVYNVILRSFTHKHTYNPLHPVQVLVHESVWFGTSFGRAMLFCIVETLPVWSDLKSLSQD